MSGKFEQNQIIHVHMQGKHKSKYGEVKVEDMMLVNITSSQMHMQMLFPMTHDAK